MLLTTAENVSPCIFMDCEIEKGLSGATGGSGDGGVSTRMVGQFLFWMQECKKQVFVVATANDVSMLPSELLRRGRFDELFFVDLPTADERRDIVSLYMRKYLNLEFIGQFADKIVEISDGSQELIWNRQCEIWHTGQLLMRILFLMKIIS